MTQHAKKFTNTPSSKKHHSEFKPVEAVQSAQKKVYEMERENVDNLLRTADGFNRAATEGMDICSGNIGAFVESGNVASRIFQDISIEMVESCNRTLSDFAEFSQEAFACRSINDVVEVQNRAVQQLCDNYFATTNKMCGMLFDSCAEALVPINKRTAIASDQIRKTLAA